MERQMRIFILGIVLIVIPVVSFAKDSEPSEDPEVAYTRAINKRAQKIVNTLGITDTEKAKLVRDIIAGQYRSLRDIHDSRDALIKTAEENAGDDKKAAEAAVKDIRDKANARQDKLHKKYLKKLSVKLSPEQVDKVKDGMTYGVRLVTYNQYLKMLPELTDKQKAKIMAFLIEARENAMDAGSSNEKHKWFRKYKGKINNYLSAAGYDLKKAEKDLTQRQKADSAEKQQPTQKIETK
jgi:Spy/CpxP family protein refolding chaperone